MKKSVILASMVASFLMSGTAFAAGKASKEQQDDAEYMMRKIVEDIHARKLRTTVTDTTLDKSIQVVGAPVKFMDKKKGKNSKELFACAHVSLKTKIRNGKKVVHQVKRTDELCKGTKSGKVLYVADIR
ncbi:hypothetical protein GUA87_04230 [Sneathiella sp. P13V-1]|uniref:hypothetical protein n=1 Tax=Sneathiella sp. P13V-1 TaxID=2697366 RepID=UPI00187BA597|nr:hypothetical protein [Sneathiella sp. P13V-1]MBE7636039.1 hypothetical protein [Sneathiella sp. P13V-1]